MNNSVFNEEGLDVGDQRSEHSTVLGRANGRKVARAATESVAACTPPCTHRGKQFTQRTLESVAPTATICLQDQ